LRGAHGSVGGGGGARVIEYSTKQLETINYSVVCPA